MNLTVETVTRCVCFDRDDKSNEQPANEFLSSIGNVTLVDCLIVVFIAGLLGIGFASNCDENVPREMHVGTIGR